MREIPGISVFEQLNDKSIVLTNQTWSRGLDWTNVSYHYLDLTPKGRQEQGLPWTMAWLKRHDEYNERRDAKKAKKQSNE